MDNNKKSSILSKIKSNTLPNIKASQKIEPPIKISINCPQSTIERDGQSFKIDPLHRRLIEFFLANPDKPLSRKELAEHVWRSSQTSDDAINRGISTLRRALSTRRDLFITTIPKVGYLFAIPQQVSLRHIPRPDPAVVKQSSAKRLWPLKLARKLKMIKTSWRL